MKKELVAQLHNAFERIVQQDEKIEFWYARDLQNLLGYNEWRNFLLVVDKAKIS
jgi:DNA-damage-inducible protein D